MDLSIVVVSYNTRPLLARCLRALPEAAAGLDWEAIVVDNASADGSLAAVAAEFPAAILVGNPDNLGFARASNQGAARARGRMVLFLNSDAEPSPGSLSALVGYLDARPRAGAVGPRLRHPDGGSPRSCFRFPSLTRPLLDTGLVRRLAGPRFSLTYPLGDRRLAEGGVVDWLSGACLLVRREALDAVRGFDERYFMYFEDTDLCRRLWALGWAVHFWPGAEVLHVGGASARGLSARLRFEVQRSRLVYFATHHPGPVSDVVRLMAALAALARAGRSLVPLRTDRLRVEAHIVGLALRGVLG
jgi:GT2 family glycosyltransferase